MWTVHSPPSFHIWAEFNVPVHILWNRSTNLFHIITNELVLGKNIPLHILTLLNKQTKKSPQNSPTSEHSRKSITQLTTSSVIYSLIDSRADKSEKIESKSSESVSSSSVTTTDKKTSSSSTPGTKTDEGVADGKSSADKKKGDSCKKDDRFVAVLVTKQSKKEAKHF